MGRPLKEAGTKRLKVERWKESRAGVLGSCVGRPGLDGFVSTFQAPKRGKSREHVQH